MKKKWSAWLLFLVLTAAAAGLIVPNLDLVLRTLDSIRRADWTPGRLRLELEAFDPGQRLPSAPAESKTSPADGMIQYRVPAGEFTMGAGTRKDHVPQFEAPAHLVTLDEFWVDRTEVTNAMYGLCVSAGKCNLPASVNAFYGKWIYRDHPVVYVSWYQAAEYCAWAGRRLPTEAEWEKAARGTDSRIYPWGGEPPSAWYANFIESQVMQTVSAYRYPLGASPYGALNMAGNVREWVADWYDPDYYVNSPSIDPQGPASGEFKSLRGGSYEAEENEIPVYHRYHHDPASPGINRGFRCVSK